MAVDEQAAVAALLAAKDQDSLVEAIEQASFLDSKPGESRQKLRAARMQLKKMKADEVAKLAAAAANNDLSPFRKPSYDAGEFEVLSAKFEKLNWRIISKPGGATVKPDDFYALYGYKQQATEGDNSGDRPMWAEKGGLDFEGRARWDAWTAVKGMTAEKAKLNFVKAYWEFGPKALYKDERGGETDKEKAEKEAAEKAVKEGAEKAEKVAADKEAPQTVQAAA